MFDDVKDQKPDTPQSDAMPHNPPTGLPIAPDQQQQASIPKPSTVEDIMADTEPETASPEANAFSRAESSQSPQGNMESSTQNMQTPPPSMTPGMTPTPGPGIAWEDNQNTGSKKKLLLVGIGVVVVALLGIGAYVGYTQFFSGSSLTSPSTDTTVETDTTATPNEVENVTTVVDDQAQLPGGDDTVDRQEPSTLIDSDGDGFTDAEEVNQYNTDPLLADTDSDGLFDREEVVSWKTDPLNPDTDGDSFLDGEEVENGYDPLGTGTLDYFGQVN